jgi:putative ABC transport system permease protein
VNWIALRLLTGDRARFLGMLTGVTFAALLIAQQASIGCGLFLRTAAHIQDAADVDIWVLAPNVEFIDELKPLSAGDPYRVRGVPGVAWASRFYRGLGRLKLGDGSSEQVFVLGVDDPAFVGAPRELLLGSLADLRQPDAVLIDWNGYRYLWPNEPPRLGRVLEMNDRRAVVVGICKAAATFHTFPTFYARYNQALAYVPQERRTLSAVLVGAEEGVLPEELCRRIQEGTGRQAVTRDQFIRATMSYYMRRTSIVINFAITVALGFLVGSAIVGQTFYAFILGQLPQLGALKAMGLSNRRIVGMVLVQAGFTGVTGYGLGVGLAATFGELATRHTQLAFAMRWQVLVGTAACVALIMTLSSLVSVRRVLVVEPAVVFRG